MLRIEGRMKISLRLTFASALLSAATPAMAQQAPRVRHGDLIVTGYATPRSYQALDELGMSGMITAELWISKVLKGRAPARTLTIRYIAHMGLPQERELRFHLRQMKGIWVVCKQGGGQGYICK
jgi:hypothetical protein